MTESGPGGGGGGGAGAGAAKLSLSTGGAASVSSHRGDGRLVISGVKAGDGNGPRVFLLSAVKAERPSATDTSATATQPASSRVSLLRTGEQVPASSHSLKPAFTSDTPMQGKKRCKQLFDFTFDRSSSSVIVF